MKINELLSMKLSKMGETTKRSTSARYYKEPAMSTTQALTSSKSFKISSANFHQPRTRKKSNKYTGKFQIITCALSLAPYICHDLVNGRTSKTSRRPGCWLGQYQEASFERPKRPFYQKSIEGVRPYSWQKTEAINIKMKEESTWIAEKRWLRFEVWEIAVNQKGTEVGGFGMNPAVEE